MNHALQNEEVELWHVEVAPNDVRVLTLEQLDEAFQRGLVNERTRVFQDGMDEPAFLGELLGLGENEEEEAPEEPVAAAPPPPAPEPKRIHQQTLVGLHADPPRSAQQPRSVYPGQPAHGSAQQSGVRPVHGAPPPMGMPSQRPQANAGYRPQSAPPAAQSRRAPPGDGAWPPVVSRAPVQPSVPPPSGPSTVSGVVAPSVVPMAMDLGAADDFDYPQRKGKGKIVLAGVAVLAVAAGVALAVTGQGASMLGSLTASAAAPAPTVKPKPIVDTKSHAYDPGSAPVKIKEDAPTPVVITTRENESEQLKAAGMTADTAAQATTATDKASPLAKPSKKAAAVSSKRAKSSGGGAPRHSGGGGAPKGPFKAGGDTHDPLNGSL